MISSKAAGDRKRRRSSILKKSPSRTALADLDTNSEIPEQAEVQNPDQRRFSKRVSFADTNQIKEISRAADIALEWCDSSSDCDTSKLNNVANLMAPIPQRGSLPLPKSSAVPGNVKDIQSLLSAPIVDTTLPGDYLDRTRGSCDMDMTNVSVMDEERKSDHVAGRNPTFASFFDNSNLGIGEAYITSPTSTSTDLGDGSPSSDDVFPEREAVKVTSGQKIGLRTEEFLSSIKPPSSGSVNPTASQDPGCSGVRKYPDINPPTYRQCVGASRSSTLPGDLMSKLPSVTTPQYLDVGGTFSGGGDKYGDVNITSASAWSKASSSKETGLVSGGQHPDDMTRVFTRESGGEMDFTECYKRPVTSATSAANSIPAVAEIQPELDNILSYEPVEMDTTCVIRNIIMPVAGTSPPKMSRSPQEDMERTKIFDTTFSADMDMTSTGFNTEHRSDEHLAEDPGSEHTKIFSSVEDAGMEVTCVTGFARMNPHPQVEDLQQKDADTPDKTKVFHAGDDGDMEITCNFAGVLGQNPVDTEERCGGMGFSLPVTASSKHHVNTDSEDRPDHDVMKRFRPGKEGMDVARVVVQTAEPPPIPDAAKQPDILVPDTQPCVIFEEDLPFEADGRSEGEDRLLSLPDDIDETMMAEDTDDTNPCDASPPQIRRKISKVRNSIAVYKHRQEKAQMSKHAHQECASPSRHEKTDSERGTDILQVSVICDEDDYDIPIKDVCLGRPIPEQRQCSTSHYVEAEGRSRELAVVDELTGAKKLEEMKRGDLSFENLDPSGVISTDWDMRLSQAKSHGLSFSSHLGHYGSDTDLVLQAQDGKTAVDIPEIREEEVGLFDTQSLFEDVPKIGVASIQEITSSFASQPLFDEEPLRITGVRGGVSDFSSPPCTDDESSRGSNKGDVTTNGSGKGSEREVEQIDLTPTTLVVSAPDVGALLDSNVPKLDSSLKSADTSSTEDMHDQDDGQVQESEQILKYKRDHVAEKSGEDDSQPMAEECRIGSNPEENMLRPEEDQEIPKLSQALLEKIKKVDRQLCDLIESHGSKEKPPTESQALEYEQNSKELSDLASYTSKLETQKLSAINARKQIVRRQEALFTQMLDDLDFEGKQSRQRHDLKNSLQLHQKYLRWHLHKHSAKQLEFSFLSQSLLLGVEFTENIPDKIEPSCQAEISSYSFQSNISTDCVIPARYELYKFLHKILLGHIPVSQLIENYPDFATLKLALQQISSLSSAAHELEDDIDWISCQVAFCSCQLSFDDDCVTVTFLPPMVGVDRFSVKFFFKQSDSCAGVKTLMQSVACHGFVATSHEYVSGRRQLDHLGESDVQELLSGIKPCRHHLRTMVQAVLAKVDHKQK